MAYHVYITKENSIPDKIGEAVVKVNVAHCEPRRVRTKETRGMFVMSFSLLCREVHTGTRGVASSGVLFLHEIVFSYARISDIFIHAQRRGKKSLQKYSRQNFPHDAQNRSRCKATLQSK